jgi:NADPH2:quinone reductase
MKAIVATAFDGPDSLKLQEVPDPTPARDEVLVNVEAVGVNFADVLAALGRYPGGPKPPFITGREFAGVRADTGERVMGYAQDSAAAEKIAAQRNMMWPAPANWTSAQAAAFPVNFLTAWLLYWKAGLLPNSGSPDCVPVGRNRRVLIHAAAGGVGTAAVMLGKLMGVETYGTASSEEKLSRLRELGLSFAINYASEDYEKRVMELTRGEGVDAVFESLGGEHTARSLRSCANLGRVILFGTATGERPKFDTLAMYSRGASVHGLWLSKLASDTKLIGQALEMMGPWIASGKLAPVIGAKFPLSAADEAHRLLLGRKNYGKVVLTVGTE